MARRLRATPDQVRSYRLTAQHLDERLGPARWTEAMAVGVQDSPPGAGPQAVAARVEGFDVGAWEKQRVETRKLVVSWSLRGAPFAHLAADHGLFSVATAPPDDAAWRTMLAWQKAREAEAGMPPSEAVATVAAAVDTVLATGPLTKSDLSTALRAELPKGLTPFCKPCGIHHVGEQVLRCSALLGRFVYGEDDPDGRFTLVATDAWSPAAAKSVPRANRPVAGGELLRRFLIWYGPADASRFAAWLGTSRADAQRRFDDAAEALVPVTVDGDDDATTWLHAGDLDAFKAAKTTRVRGVRLLPRSDPYLQQRDREVIVPDRERQRSVWKHIGSPGVVLVDGTVAGIWRPQKKGARLTLVVEPFDRLSDRDRPRLEEEAERTAQARGAELTGLTVKN